jgi:hypothetical protein
MTGVITREHARQQRWADLGLPDPVQVLAEEQHTRERLPEHLPDFRSPKRAALQAHFDAHPDEQPPRGW